MRASRAFITEAVEQTDLFEGIDIKQVSREAKIGWLKTLILVAVWPLIKSVLLQKVNPKIVKIIDQVINGV